MAGCKLFFIDVGDSPGTYLPEGRLLSLHGVFCACWALLFPVSHGVAGLQG